MKRISILVVLFLSPMLSMASQTEPASGFLDPQSAAKPADSAGAAKPNSREDEMYFAAKAALDNANYDKAITEFNEIAAMKGRRADAALYWKAYALRKAGNNEEALTTVAELRKNYPRSTWLKQASAVDAEARTALGKPPLDPDKESDEELKMMAVISLAQTEPERAVPILQKLLEGDASTRLKDKALFVLAQMDSEKAQQALLAVAKGEKQPELQKSAIRWLAVNGNGRNRETLRQIYSSSTNPEIKKSVLHSFIINGDKEAAFNIARTDPSPELRHEALRQLGVMGAHNEIRQLYKETTDPATKESLLQAMGVGGDVEGLTEAATNEKDPKVRSKAISNLGVFGGRRATGTLVAIYSGQSDTETKHKIIQALFVNGAAHEMIELARKETNPELKKTLVQRLSLMDSPEVHEYMMEILNK